MVHGSAQTARKAVRAAAPEVAQSPLEFAGVASGLSASTSTAGSATPTTRRSPSRLAPGRPEYGRPVAGPCGAGL